MSNKNDSMSHTYTKGSGTAFGSSIKLDAPGLHIHNVNEKSDVSSRDLSLVLKNQLALESRLDNIEKSLESLRDQLYGPCPVADDSKTVNVNYGLIDNMLGVTSRSAVKAYNIENLIGQIADGFGTSCLTGIESDFSE
ncbi:hypothetical protein CPM16_003160 [Escherichia coli]|nr:hypothetical protein [Escherichia coli]